LLDINHHTLFCTELAIPGYKSVSIVLSWNVKSVKIKFKKCREAKYEAMNFNIPNCRIL
jgi:hypothetical protein